MLKLLQSQILPLVVERNRCGVIESLKGLRDTITLFSRQGPIIHFHEKKKVEYLLDLVARLDWAQSSIIKCATSTPPWNFQQ